MQEFVSVSQKVDDICGKCGVKNKKECCKTEIKLVKVDDSQKSDLLHIDFLGQISGIPVKHQFTFVDHSFSASKFTQIQINGPPEYKPVPIYIHHCNFRI
ncbi:hypothetical protein C1631_003185 [Chryseobacterium phosphatilyticum]|uniref:Uncharacterized protein n=2 Tax=Chryseobacterium phosphatilyticum TaxID=475075 RepID=A0A316XM09_9FLAO|nr:hypothetical protein C1631_003185 [Chryseobacterium phosphatilyticum]